jgi:hypothetical protein
MLELIHDIWINMGQRRLVCVTKGLLCGQSTPK